MANSLCLQVQADIKVIFGQVLKEFRLKKGLTQQSLADFAEMDRKYISRLENGDQMASVETLFRLSRHLKIKPSDFVDRMILKGKSSRG